MSHRGKSEEAEEGAEGEGSPSAEYVARHRARPVVVVVVSASLVSGSATSRLIPAKEEERPSWQPSAHRVAVDDEAMR